MLDPSEAFSTGMTEAGHWQNMAGQNVSICPITRVKDERDAVPGRVQVIKGLVEATKSLLEADKELPPLMDQLVLVEATRADAMQTSASSSKLSLSPGTGSGQGGPLRA